MKYDFKAIEQKWQAVWEEKKTFQAKDGTDKKKWYGLVEFPYPSGAGMHVGHIKAYSGLEVISRKRRMEGYNVLFPIGFDAFGLPAENYAIKTGVHPRLTTDRNIAHFTDQLKRAGFSFDWSRVIDTSSDEYYRWTQWIFLKMFENGLAFRDTALVNYCPSCKVVLSNEDSQGGKCDICHSDVIQKTKDVWYLRITRYADKLLEGLDHVDYLPNVRQQQINWIGKSTGAFVDFKLKDTDEKLRVYTTRPDTLYGVTFMVIAPEHPILDKYRDRVNMDEIEAYRAECARKTEFERTQLVKDKTGVRIQGLTGINPLTGQEVPIYAADYVMMGYGTGAIMAVPAHDQRDYEFAKTFGLDIVQVIEGGDISKEAYAGEGKMINSGFLNGLSDKKSAIRAAIAKLEELGLGEEGVQYKMKDWAFNRQRYWGEPIPIVHCPKCGMVPVPYEELPLRLPEVKEFLPGEGGESPLARIESFVNCKCPKCGGKAKRETDTMPQWAGSSWYYLRYIDPKCDTGIADPEKMKYWMPVDLYIGGPEHAVGHLLYSRMWNNYLYDKGLVPCAEPFQKLVHQGYILGSNGIKMGKRFPEYVVNPSDIVERYGADTLRLYEMFMGPLEADKPWSTQGIEGAHRWLERVYRLMTDKEKIVDTNDGKLDYSYNFTVKKVSEDIENLRLNTAISQMMIFINDCYKEDHVYKEYAVNFVQMLSVFAPHLGCEMYEMLTGKQDLAYRSWPEYDESKLVVEEKEIAVQVNGKVRAKFNISANASDEELYQTALQQENVKKYTDGNEIKKHFVIRGRVVNIVI